MDKNKNDFTQGKVWRVIMRMAIPMMLAQLVNVLYSVVDRIYIGHIPGVGSLALTGLGLTMPIVNIVTAFAALCGTGGGPLCSIARGEGKKKYAEKIMGNAFCLLLVFSIVLTVLLLIFSEPLLYLFGASDDTIGYAKEYLGIYLWGTVFVMISLGMNYFINAQGFARIGMLTVLLGAVINIVLDPVFIFLLDMGISGAALATVIAQCASAVWAMLFLLSDKTLLDLKLNNMIPEPRLLGRILGLGITGFIMNITGAIVQVACNAQLQRLGGDLYVGAMTVINSVREVILMAAQGLAAGAQPVIGYNYGAKAYSRVKRGIRFVTGANVIYALLVWISIMLIPGVITRAFNSDAALVAVSERSMRIYFCGFCFMALHMSGQYTFVGLGKSRQAVFFSLLRKVIIVTPLVYILPSIPALGVNGVFWSEPISDIVSGVFCYLTMYLTTYRRLPPDDEKPV